MFDTFALKITHKTNYWLSKLLFLIEGVIGVKIKLHSKVKYPEASISDLKMAAFTQSLTDQNQQSSASSVH